MSALSIIAAAIAVVAVMGITAAITKRTGKAAYVDAAWGASFVAAMAAAVLAVVVDGGTPSWRAWLIFALVAVWGVRLSWHLGRRVRAWDHDDPRYESYLGGPISEVPFGRVVLKVFALQALLVIFVSVPLTLGAVRRPVNPWLVMVGVALWLLGVIFEAVSDAQLAAFRADPNRARILATGLWAWSRHPNYFGDFCVWWGFWLIGAAATGWRDGLATLLSPLLMSWILIGISGVRLAEKRMQGRPGWAAYAARTPIFVPWPPVRARAPKAFAILPRLVCAGGLVLDARIHLRLAPAYDAIRGSLMSQGDLFRIEAGLAIVSVLLILVVHKRIATLLVIAVAGGGLVALLVYRYFDIGAVGPLPPMYEPVWYPDKVTTCVAQAVSTLIAIGLLFAPIRSSDRIESGA